jgi:di/tricarboxylate transporter
MRITLLILGFIMAIIGLALSVLPFGTLALIPIVLAFILGLIAWRRSHKESKSVTPIKVLFLIVIVSLGLAIYNSLRPNEVDESVELQVLENSDEEIPMEELDALDIED